MGIQQKNWYIQIDGLRFIAVFAVLIEHFAYVIGHPLKLGFFGVDLFFVISGFLITEILLQEKLAQKRKGSVLSRFYLKRFLRIFPVYYFLLIVAFILYPASREIAGWSFSYTINYYTSFTGEEVLGPFQHLWSLSVEEQFYIFWPLGLLLLPAKAIPYFLGLCFSSSLTYFLMTSDFVGLPGRMYTLCLGGGLACLKTFNNNFYNTYRKKISIVLPVLAVVTFFSVSKHAGISLLSTFLVYTASLDNFHGLFRKIIENNRLVYLGKISYGIYLYHLPLGYLLTYYVFDPVWQKLDFGFMPALQYNSWIIKFPLYTIMAILVAHISYIFIEKPFLKMKSKV